MNILMTMLFPLIMAECSQKCFYDYYILALQWPKSYDFQLDHWTIHGLWPSIKNSEEYPCYCRDEDFDENSVSLFRDQMNEYWPSLIMKPAYQFWFHEWTKHGTCIQNSQPEYFRRTLDLYREYEPLPKLSNNDIIPGSVYSYENLSRVLGKSVTLGCKFHSDIQYLSEIGVCLSKKFEEIDCTSGHRNSNDEVNSCKDDDIYYF
jgi:ribonuclease I